ncbi:hypothetical protein FSP39_022740 [Pinctada imbricata]|uniref:CCHC-type domain-containing protein n=1 Tax=Pinctada imbricata TaxID=66713 RepID=A0AA88YET7_PINIB|nr:hypothetical protein FSP39_022740 [Pinctada imbricata]
MDLEKIVAIGKDMGLEGAKLHTFVLERENAYKEREKEKLDRDERAADRMIKQQERELKAKELEIERLKIEVDRNEHSMVVGASASSGSNVHAKVPKLPVFDEKSDCIDAYLQRFERFAENAKWDRSLWSINLSALLKGKALDVYSRLPTGEAMNYDALKQELLKRFQLTEEGFHTKFRTCKPEQGESPQQFVSRLSNYLERWMSLAKAAQTYGGLKDLLLREQFLTSCNSNLAIFLKERHPQNVQEMTTLAEQFIEAHNNNQFGSEYQRMKRSHEGRRCYNCGFQGHIARECPNQKTQSENVPRLVGASQESIPPNSNRGGCTNRGRGVVRGYHSGNRPGNGRGGHIGSVCILVDTLQDCCIQDDKVLLACGHAIPVIGGACKVCDDMPVHFGYISGKRVQVLRDSGCTSVVVKENLTSPSQLTGENRSCVLIDRTIRNFPEAVIDIDTPFYTGKVTALVMQNPVFDLIIGNIHGARDKLDPDPEWNPKIASSENFHMSDCFSDCMEETDHILQSVQTRNQKKKEAQGLKSLKVSPTLLQNSLIGRRICT